MIYFLNYNSIPNTTITVITNRCNDYKASEVEWRLDLALKKRLVNFHYFNLIP